MSGPIVRSAPSKKFSSNWDAIFGGAPSSDARSAAGSKNKSAKKKPEKDKPVAKSAARKPAKKKKKS